MRPDLLVQLSHSLCNILHYIRVSGYRQVTADIPDSQYKKHATCNLILILLDKGREELKKKVLTE